ncbi:MAG TPA: MerR family transcriptional regulator [Gaiellaceae bacterium]|nr:MerR family transcriptional regulator [Gaiellaceae bacterium]
MSHDAELHQIGEVAERVGLSLRTVRYYEEVGLVRPSARSDGGFRLYSEDDIQRLLVVKRMKPLGLTLDEMAQLLEGLEQSARPDGLDVAELGGVVARLAEFAERSDERIAALERELSEARTLRLRISERLGRCEAVLERAGKTPR